MIRTGHLDALDALTWGQVHASGLRTVVDLRNPDADRVQTPRPSEVLTEGRSLELGLDADPVFAEWVQAGWWCTALYYDGFLRRWPQRCADVLETIAQAEPGGVIVHCAQGKDRTGLIVALLCILAGVDPAAISADHHRSTINMGSAVARSLGVCDDRTEMKRVYAAAGSSQSQTMTRFLEEWSRARVLDEVVPVGTADALSARWAR